MKNIIRGRVRAWLRSDIILLLLLLFIITSFPCIKYRMQLRVKRALGFVRKISSSAEYGKAWLRVT